MDSNVIFRLLHRSLGPISVPGSIGKPPVSTSTDTRGECDCPRRPAHFKTSVSCPLPLPIPWSGPRVGLGGFETHTVFHTTGLSKWGTPLLLFDTKPTYRGEGSRSNFSTLVVKPRSLDASSLFFPLSLHRTVVVAGSRSRHSYLVSPVVSGLPVVGSEWSFLDSGRGLL